MLVPQEDELKDFLEKVEDVSILIDGLKAGTISPDYVDNKIERLSPAREQGTSNQINESGRGKQADETDEEQRRKAEERKEKALRKVQELQANRERKLKARQKYEAYVAQRGMIPGTDYTKWSMWCPEDEEDELFNSLTPNNPQFRALEKDIDERHQRMVEQRQIAERQRVAGNEAYKKGQYSEALRCYEIGIEAQRWNMTLQANAAMACLKLNCYVQTIEHCDRVLSACEGLHGNINDPLCVKALQRRATAYKALKQLDKVVEDLEKAAEVEVTNTEVQSQLAEARRELEEYQKQKAVRKAMSKGVVHEQQLPSGFSCDLNKLHKVETLVRQLQPPSQHSAMTSSPAKPVAHPAGTGAHAETSTLQASTASQQGAAAPASTSTCHSSPQADGAESPTHHSPSPQGQQSAGAGTATKLPTLPRPQLLKQTCKQLAELLRGDDASCVYFRECGGMVAAALQVVTPEPVAPSTRPAAPAAFLNLLNTAAMNDGNLEMLPQLPGLLEKCVSLLGVRIGAADEDASAAACLLATAATSTTVRKALSSQLAGTPSALSALLTRMKRSTAREQLFVLNLLGNCAVDKEMKACFKTLMSMPTQPEAVTKAVRKSEDDKADTQPHPVVQECLLSMLKPGQVPEVAEKAMYLLGNLCGDSQLRSSLAACHALVAGIAAWLPHKKVMPGSKSGPTLPPTVPAALVALQNLLLEPAAVTHLIRMHGTAASSDVSADQDNVTSVLLSLLDVVEVQTRTAGVLARVAKVAEGSKALDNDNALTQLCHTLKASLENPSPTPPSISSPSPPSDGSSSSSGLETPEQQRASFQEALVRCIVMMLSALSPGEERLQSLVDLGLPTSLIKLLQQNAGGSLEATQANAALALSSFSAHASLRPCMLDLKAVDVLIQVAYKGQGNTASKNAAITLAKLALHPPCLERLKELHGLEIIYQYVKP